MTAEYTSYWNLYPNCREGTKERNFNQLTGNLVISLTKLETILKLLLRLWKAKSIIKLSFLNQFFNFNILNDENSNHMILRFISYFLLFAWSNRLCNDHNVVLPRIVIIF